MLDSRVRACWRAVWLATGLTLAAGSGAAMDLQVSMQAGNSVFNPGPFSAGDTTTVALDFRIDASVVPTGATPTWQAALDNLVLRIDDAALGSFTVTGQDGRWQQLSASTDFLFGGWQGNNGGTLSPLSVVNPALSATPFVLTDISFDLRGSSLLANASTLPTAATIADFSFLSLVLGFSNADPAVGAIPKATIIRGASFTAVTISPVPEPAALVLMLAGLGVLAWRRRAGVDAAGVAGTHQVC